jgi:hypothetical protein
MESLLRDLAERLSALERDIDAGSYQAGRWGTLLRDLRRLSRSDRLVLSEAISRVSNKLHTPKATHRVSFGVGLAVEGGLALLGAGILWWALEIRAAWAAVVAALIWTMAFQPLIKILTGTVLGIRYAYAYLLGPEPRFKMRYGTYVAAPNSARIAFHISGTLGSPLGAWLPVPLLGQKLPTATTFCWLLFGMVVAINLVPFILALAGHQRIGRVRLSLGSAGSAAVEIRDALHQGRG